MLLIGKKVKFLGNSAIGTDYSLDDVSAGQFLTTPCSGIVERYPHVQASYKFLPVKDILRRWMHLTYRHIEKKSML